MANPVIFDDGGSTRIKLLLAGGGAGVMDGLLDVDMAAVPPVSDFTVTRTYTTIKVSAIDASGTPVALLVSPLVTGDTCKIESDNGQIVSFLISGAARHCAITVTGSAANAPLVDAKQFRKKRRYVIANAGPIQRVSGTANGAPFDFNTSANSYTTVFVSD